MGSTKQAASVPRPVPAFISVGELGRKREGRHRIVEALRPGAAQLLGGLDRGDRLGDPREELLGRLDDARRRRHAAGSAVRGRCARCR